MTLEPILQNNHKIYATDLMDLIYCQRLFYLKKILPFTSKETSASVAGTVEHESRRILTKFLEPIYSACSSLDRLQNLDYSKTLGEALNYSLELGTKRFPELSHLIESFLFELSFRLQIEEKRRHEKAISLAKKGIRIQKITEMLFPWAVELGVGSKALGITGRIDEVYKLNDHLVPVDFKTHTSRFASFLWRDAHVEQLSVYALLLELQYQSYKVKNGFIKYTQDLHDYPVKFSSQDKKDVLNHIEESNIILENQMPPRLTGKESIKCNHCYIREKCFSIKGDISTC